MTAEESTPASRWVRRTHLTEVRPQFSRSTWDRIIRTEGLPLVRYGQRCTLVDLDDVDRFLAGLTKTKAS